MSDETSSESTSGELQDRKAPHETAQPVDKDNNNDKWKNSPAGQGVEFFVHVVVGTGIFLLVLGPAVGLDLLVQKLPEWGISHPIIFGLSLAKFFLFGLDLGLYLLFLLNISWVFFLALIRTFNRSPAMVRLKE